MTFVTFLILTLAAVLALGVTRAADRHRRWTLALVERHQRRVADGVERGNRGERDPWEAGGETVPGPAMAPAAPRDPASRRIELRVRD